LLRGERGGEEIGVVAPVGLEQEAVDLFEIDAFGLVANGFEQTSLGGVATHVPSGGEAPDDIRWVETVVKSTRTNDLTCSINHENLVWHVAFRALVFGW
jgi:hypothetical protein